MKFFIVAGEASGDVHGANLAKELLKIYPNAEFSGTGGINLKSLGQKQYFTDSDMWIFIVPDGEHACFYASGYRDTHRPKNLCH